jgi:hypothetical protein
MIRSPTGSLPRRSRLARSPSPPPRAREREVHALTRLADGCGHRGDPAAFAAYAARSPQARHELARQRALVVLLHAGGPRLPTPLRRQLETTPRERSATAADHRPARPRLTPVRIWATATACILAAAIAGVGTWRATSAGPQGPPTIGEVAMLAFRDPTAVPPRADPSDPSFLRGEFAGVTFPDYQDGFGARTWGQRTDLTAGRTIRTVYYRLGNARPISYSVVSGAPLAIPPSAHQVIVARIRVRSYRERGLSYVTLIRHGRTCVLSSRLPASALEAMAVAPLVKPDRV